MLANSSLEYFKHLLPHNKSLSFLTTRHYTLAKIKALFPNYSFIEMKQPHGNQIAFIEAKTNKASEVDACITNQKKQFLVVRTADCLPILMATDSGFLAAIHAGRKSTELQISKKVCKKLLDRSNFSFLSVWLGPRICKSCYEINPKTKEHYDLLEENKSQIKTIVPDNIKLNLYNSGMCTFCSHRHLFYSHRAGHSERVYCGIAWK